MTVKAKVSLALLLAAVVSSARPSAQDGTCNWAPPSGRVTEVRNVRELAQAVARVEPGETILLHDGRYPLESALEITQPNVTIRSRSRNAAAVVLHGQGMTNDGVGVALAVGAPGVTIAEITIRDVGYHAVQVRGERGASRFALRGARLMDAGQQLLKGSVERTGPYADEGLVACSQFEYTTSAPSDYTNGIDVLAAKGWRIVDNRFYRMRGPESGNWRSGPAILMWAASEDTIVERNLIVDSFRGIAFGLGPGASTLARNGERRYDHRGGVIRNNVIVNLNPWADEAIEANAATGVRIEHNTVLVESRTVRWSIGVRFRSGSAHVRNNLTNNPVLLRNGGQATQETNLVTAERAWFVNAAAADLRLAPAGRSAVNVGVAIADAVEDYDGRPRPVGSAPDAGAFEFRPPVPQN